MLRRSPFFALELTCTVTSFCGVGTTSGNDALASSLTPF